MRDGGWMHGLAPLYGQVLQPTARVSCWPEGPYMARTSSIPN